MRRSRTMRPQLESLESMTLLSAISPVHKHPGGIVAAKATHANVATAISLNGTFEGAYHVAAKANHHKGLDYVFSGDGAVGVLGFTQVTGNLNSVGNVTKGHATGPVVLSTKYGSLRLQLTGPTQHSMATLPEGFTYKITSGTGKYRGDEGTGKVFFVPDAYVASTSTGSEAGTFAMVFVS